MEDSFNSEITKSYVYVHDNIITGVNDSFVDLTGFSMNELVGKSLIRIGGMLRINSQILLQDIDASYSGFIFTKSFEVREVDISLLRVNGTTEKIYCFAEKTNSRLDDKLIFVDHIFTENKSGAAVYSVPGFILLKANRKYLDFMNAPFNNPAYSIGRPLKEIFAGFAEVKFDELLKNFVENKKVSFKKEFKFNSIKKGITYWDTTQSAVSVDGEVKYLFQTTTEVTERVIKNQDIKRQDNIIHKQREQLAQLKINLANIIEDLTEGVLILHKKGKVLFANSEARRLTCKDGRIFNLEDINDTEICDMEGNKISFENHPVIRAFKGERVKNYNVSINLSGKKYFADISSTPICNKNGDLDMVLACIHDTTETIQKSKKIELQKKELEAVIENISDGISIFNKEGQYIVFNKSAREIFFPTYQFNDRVDDGYKKWEAYDIDGNRICEENLPPNRIMRGERFENVRMTIKQLNKVMLIDVSGTPIYDNDGKFSLGVFCVRDMSEYFKNEQVIRSKYEFLYKTIETFNLPVIRISCLDMVIVGINIKACNLIRMIRPDIRSIKELKGIKCKDLIMDFKTSIYNTLISQVFKEKKTQYLNKKSYNVNGSELYLNMIFEPMFDLNGEIEDILVLIIDVTDEINSNIAMEKTLKLQEEFFTNISHELKTPLNVIFASNQLLNMYCSGNSLNERKDSILNCIGSIKQNSYRLSRLINNIVDLSKIEAGFFMLNITNNNIVEIVRNLVKHVNNIIETKGLSIAFNTDMEEKIIACDSEEIERVILNLLSNAIKFSDEGDEISVEIKNKNEFVEISVRDSGIGIDANYIDMIFDRFKQVDKSLTRNAEGAGVGLSLVKSIVELHGGHIYAESELGVGSKFTVTLPSGLTQQKDRIPNKITNRTEIIQVEFSDVC